MLVDNETHALRAAWHCVAHVDEIGHEPHQVWLLGQTWVVVRLDGSLAAFVDRCPHRLAPLSAGSVVRGDGRKGGDAGDGGDGGDELQCGYHGWRFDRSGSGTAIPALGPTAVLPPRACVTPAFAVEERFGLVFLAPERPHAPLPEFRSWNDNTFLRAVCQTRRTPVSAAQLIDNFMDAAHFPFVHAATFGVEGAGEVATPDIERSDMVVRTTFDAPYQNHDDPLVASGEHPLVQPHRVMKAGFANYICELELSFETTAGTFWILYACQPERNGSTRVYKLIARNDLGHDPTRIDQVAKDEDVILLEDLRILERYEHMGVDLDLTRELHTKADRLSVAWRRLIGSLVTSASLDND